MSDVFDPADHTVAEVNAHVEKADPDEARRVLNLERAGKARQSVNYEAAPARPRTYTVPPGGVPTG